MEYIEKLEAENQRLKEQLSRYQAIAKGVQRDVFDIDSLAKNKNLEGSLFSMQSYGPCGEQDKLSKLGSIVRGCLFSDQKISIIRRYRSGKREINCVVGLKDLTDKQYNFYKIAMERVYSALDNTVSEYRHSREGDYV